MWNHPNRNFGLDCIRASAIILVVLSHCTFILPEFNSIITDGIRLLGATGVDIFFVLSGYLIGGILLKHLKSNKIRFKDLFHFWKRRWLRTLPNYFVVLSLNLLLILFLGKSLLDEVWLYFPFLQNFLSPHPDFFTEAWSLSIEEYAYLILPFVIYSLLLFFKRIKATKVFFYATLSVIIVLFFFKIQFYFNAEIDTYKEWSSQFRKVVLYRLDAIYYGFIMVYLVSKYSFFESKRKLLFLFGLFLFVLLHLIIVLFNVMPQDYKWFYSLCYLPLISSSIALVFPFFLELKARRRVIKLVTYISKRSYSIYLVNYSLVLLTIEHFFEPSILALLLYLSISIILSEVLYRCVEIPFLRLRSRIVPR
ncbi:acyltransferase family protein [Winogradskyella jejuensis]|uniref:Peptidoglycan/LPS O-acetylase OafA/YrhL, contains acyltransferase and SGNH-hydrolase domains n=1 Tax=Winogradskyella jejuensis TaxID=1089305 RepID=A0A1M5JIM5_9FLAO|nr:acyltransferase [Winogradskyella jejuensis]SHG40255.1 Peptidoglycan/LPS O-acetylase OafA/YrhL, contains acyltransferase and SGNH-hydrolase domains [Winogradskyella jejuensis]